MYTREELVNMTDDALIELVASQAISVVEAKDAMSSRRLGSRTHASFTTTIVRQSDSAAEGTPRQVRVFGEGIDCPSRQKLDTETDEMYYDSLPSIKAHLGELIWLLTVGRMPFLKDIISRLGDPKVVELPSRYDEDRVYKRTVASIGHPEHNVYVQLGRSPNVDEATFLVKMGQHAIDNSEEETSGYPELGHEFRINSTTPSAEVSENDSF